LIKLPRPCGDGPEEEPGRSICKVIADTDSNGPFLPPL